MYDAEAVDFTGSCPVVYHTVHAFYSGISKLWFKFITKVTPVREFKVKKKNKNQGNKLIFVDFLLYICSSGVKVLYCS